MLAPLLLLLLRMFPSLCGFPTFSNSCLALLLLLLVSLPPSLSLLLCALLATRPPPPPAPDPVLFEELKVSSQEALAILRDISAATGASTGGGAAGGGGISGAGGLGGGHANSQVG